ncbi:hypothetical protein BKA62DRAFT_724149 [Auriculariales sp. MPI-PUGE-AT-0066]|nr:hypothetical protein BKA62DRAFT_724149 [Auriculariales sp. MPI-PUGE-AT-0066]
MTNLRRNTLCALVTASAAAVAQMRPIPDGGMARVIVASSKFDVNGCLTSTGTVTEDFPEACGTFRATSRSRRRAAPLVCGPASNDTDELGFFSFEGRMATKEFQTEWFLDDTPGDETTRTLYWQGLHPDRATLIWVPVESS